ncbi:MAG: hypothetical protein ACR2PA_10240, partial [Hyphomicrobiaceae bacterium]
MERVGGWTYRQPEIGLPNAACAMEEQWPPQNAVRTCRATNIAVKVAGCRGNLKQSLVVPGPLMRYWMMALTSGPNRSEVHQSISAPISRAIADEGPHVPVPRIAGNFDCGWIIAG